MNRSAILLLLAVFAAAAICHGCGGIGGGAFPCVATPKATVGTPASPASADITISFVLIDRELDPADITLEYSTDGGQTYTNATLTNPAEGTGLATGWHPGRKHTVSWNSLGDMIGLSGAVEVKVKITPSDASNPAGIPGTSGSFTVNNIAYNDPPTVALTTPGGVQSGGISVNYTLTDTEGDACSITVEYSIDGGAWQAATMGPAGDGTSGLSSSPSGTGHMFLWDSSADGVGLAGQQDNVSIRITPADFNAGTADQTGSFSVDNSLPNEPPTVDITGGPADGSTVETTQVTFTWSGSDTDGFVQGYYYSFDHDPPDVWITDITVTSSPLSEGLHTFRVVAMDDDSEFSAVASRTFTVLPAGALEITTESLPNGIEGQPYSTFLTAAGGTPSYTWSCTSGDLSAIGLSLDAGTGEIAGVFSTGSAGVHDFTFRVDDSGVPSQYVQKPLSITVTVSGNQWTRIAADCDFGPDDGNYKLLFEENMIKLAPEGDVFGNVLDSNHWTELTGTEIIVGWEGKGSASLSETGGILTNIDGGSSAWAIGARREVTYLDADIVFEWGDNDGADKSYGAGHAAFLWRNVDNFVRISYDCRAVSGNHRLQAASNINGAWSNLFGPTDVGLHTRLRMRIKRESSTNTFTFYYATWGGSDWNTWQEVWSGVVNDPTHFNTLHELYPIEACRIIGAVAETFTPEVDRYFQYTADISAQRFWDDSPECDIIDTGAGTPEYCLDAGAGGTWTLTGFSALAFMPGTSTIKFKAGWSDSATRASATWINGGTWMTGSELDVQVAAAALDGHRYVFLKAQFNSDGTDQPILANVTFTGAPSADFTAGAFDISPAFDDNNQKIIIDGGIAKLAPDGDVFGSVIDIGKWTDASGGSASVVETGGILQLVSPVGGDDAILRREVGFLDADIASDISSTNGENTGADQNRAGLDLWKDSNNRVLVLYKPDAPAGSHHLDVYTVVNSSWTLVHRGDIGLHTSIKLRLKRVTGAGNQAFTAYYDIGAGWVEVWSGSAYDAATFNEAHLLKPAVWSDSDVSWSNTVEVTSYYQIGTDIGYQRFWDDSPELLVVDHAGADWAFDAGAGHYWNLSNASCVKSEPGTSSILFKVGYSDTGDDADVTWVDATWQTISQVDTNAASGSYDGHRHIHVRAQFNSDGTDQPTLTSVTFTGSAVSNTYTATAFDTTPSINDNNEKIKVDSGIAKLQTWSDKFGSVLDTSHIFVYTGDDGNVSEAGGALTFTNAWTDSGGWRGSTSVFLPQDDPGPYKVAGKPVSFCVDYVGFGDESPIDRYLYIYVYYDSDNWDYIRLQRGPIQNRLLSQVYQGGVSRHLVNFYNWYNDNAKLKILVNSTGHYFYYDIGAGWVLFDSHVGDTLPDGNYSFLITTQVLDPVAPGSISGDINEVWFEDGVFYWDDSPEVLVVDHAGGDWAFDAGAGLLWQIFDADCVKSEPGTSSVKFKVGGSDTGNGAEVLWLDATWLTISEVKARAASGAYDGNRYIHVKAQFNSDGTDQPSLSSFSISGTKAP